MKSSRASFLMLGFAALVLVIAQGAKAQQLGPPAPVISGPIDASTLVTLFGNTRPEAIPANDRGRVANDFPLPHMLLQLKRSPEREAALKTYIDQLHDRTSPNFHQWLTAESFAQQYGVAPADVDTVQNWLQSNGFTINGTLPSGLVIDFSGTAGMVAQAFHTQIHTLVVNGETHFANMGDPEIPAALAPVVTGVVSLHNFRPQSMLQPVPSYTVSPTVHLVVPGDITTIYNINPVFAAGYTGLGQTIMLIEDSNTYSGDGDWLVFRKIFGLTRPYPHATFTIIQPAGAMTCADPGVNGDGGEAAIDVEWASAAAPNAAIVLASCATTAATYGTLPALVNAVNLPAAQLPTIISMSYGESETASGAALIAAYNSAFEQGAAEGISEFVSSGDADAALNDRNDYYDFYGINGMNGWGASQYVTLVGGTDFGVVPEGLGIGNYWNSTNTATYESAKSYIPEIPWNNSCASALTAAYFGSTPLAFCNASYFDFATVGGSGGPSACYTGSPSLPRVVSGSCAGEPKPAFQAGLLGNPADGVRDSPDVSLFASNGIWGSYYVVCWSDPAEARPCTGAPSTWAGFGGTSISSPIMAGIQALINQKTGMLWGNVNVEYYAAAKVEYATAATAALCNSNTVNPTSNTCTFYNITKGDSDSACVTSYTTNDCYTGGNPIGLLSTSTTADDPAYATNTGWSFPAGIGSPNAFNLVNNPVFQ